MPDPKNVLVVEGPVDYEDLPLGGYLEIFRVVSCDVADKLCFFEYENHGIPTAGLSDEVLSALPAGWAAPPPGPRISTRDLRTMACVDDEIIAVLREERGVTVEVIDNRSAACGGGGD